MSTCYYLGAGFWFFVLMKFSVVNGIHMDGHIICDLTVVHFWTGFFNLAPRAVNMLRAPLHLNPALLLMTA